MNDQQKINLIVVLYDIINQLTTELKPSLRHNLKRLTNNADIQLNLLIREVDKVLNDKSEGMGDVADKLRILIDKHLLR